MLICALATGCASKPAPDRSAGVHIPRDCEELAQQVEGPTWRKDQDAIALLLQTTAALDEANGNLASTRACQQITRETYAKKGG